MVFRFNGLWRWNKRFANQLDAETLLLLIIKIDNTTEA